MQTVLLGTAQWGLDYGITNTVGRPDDHALAQTITVARELGIRLLDTAPAYGDAEDRIGRFGDGFDVQTKVGAGAAEPDDIVASVRRSLVRLNRSRTRSCLVHDWPSLDADGRRAAHQGLSRCRDEGLVDAIGISAYTVADLRVAAESFPGLDLVQVPVSVLDQRLEDSDIITGLRAEGVHVQARSIVLQGLALAERPEGRAAHPDVVRVGEVARAAGVSRLAVCLSFVRTRAWVDEVVIASSTPAELRELVAALAAPLPAIDWTALASGDDDLLDPRRWTAPSREG